MDLPTDIVAILAHSAPVFAARTWPEAQPLAVGALLAIGRRTVASALHVVGRGDEPDSTNYHRLPNRDAWSALQAGRVLLGLIPAVLPKDAPLVLAADDTVERRDGPKIKAKKTTIDWARQLALQVRRWAPGRRVALVVDGVFASVALAAACRRHEIALVCRLESDAAFYDNPIDPPPGRRGPKPKEGPRQPSPARQAACPEAAWSEVEVAWHGGRRRAMEVLTGLGLVRRRVWENQERRGSSDAGDVLELPAPLWKAVIDCPSRAA